MKKILISMLLLISVGTVQAQQEDELTKEVRELIELSNPTAAFTNGLTLQLQPFVKQGILTPESLAALIKDMESYALPLIVDRMAATYKEHFTLEEVKQIKAYLTSPAGQKAIKLQPQLMEESAKVIQTPEAQQKIQEIAARYLSK